MATAHTVLIFAAGTCFLLGAILHEYRPGLAVSLGLLFWLMASSIGH